MARDPAAGCPSTFTRRKSSPTIMQPLAQAEGAWSERGKFVGSGADGLNAFSCQPRLWHLLRARELSSAICRRSLAATNHPSPLPKSNWRLYATLPETDRCIVAAACKCGIRWRGMTKFDSKDTLRVASRRDFDDGTTNKKTKRSKPSLTVPDFPYKCPCSSVSRSINNRPVVTCHNPAESRGGQEHASVYGKPASSGLNTAAIAQWLFPPPNLMTAV
jgi:hypothetical protein